MKHLRHLPAVHQLKKHQRFVQIIETQKISEDQLTVWLSQSIDHIRERILSGDFHDDTPSRKMLTKLIFAEFEQFIDQFLKNRLTKVINATGIILHTNLGRARLSKRAIKQMTDVATHYSTLEYNLEDGRRGSRHDIVENYLQQLTGAEAAIVVNNNAAAVYFILKAIAEAKEVIVSRGELVEIGGSFRISDIMEESGARLVGVGTTNKTHLVDYERAITDRTGLFLKVHQSNFKMIGFTEAVNTDDLISIAKKHHMPIYEDLGSGTLFDFKTENIGKEPTVAEKVNAGVDLISFSGDKLLGGPQAGIIVGKKEFIDKLKHHQLARVLRVDKFTLASLEATLKAYISGQAINEIPTIRDMLTSAETVLKRAQTFIEKVSNNVSGLQVDIQPDVSKVGGGTMPDVNLSTYVVRIKHNDYSSEALAERLRSFKTPIITRVKDDALLLDFRTVSDEELYTIFEAFLQIQQKDL